MEIRVTGEPKEIAALVLQLQERQSQTRMTDKNDVSDLFKSILTDQAASSGHTLSW